MSFPDDKMLIQKLLGDVSAALEDIIGAEGEIYWEDGEFCDLALENQLAASDFTTGGSS